MRHSALPASAGLQSKFGRLEPVVVSESVRMRQPVEKLQQSILSTRSLFQLRENHTSAVLYSPIRCPVEAVRYSDRSTSQSSTQRWHLRSLRRTTSPGLDHTSRTHVVPITEWKTCSHWTRSCIVMSSSCLPSRRVVPLDGKIREFAQVGHWSRRSARAADPATQSNRDPSWDQYFQG